MLRTIKVGIERTLITITSLMLVIMLGLAILQVTSRYIFQTPAIYTEESLRFIMIWMGLLGAAYAFGTDQHLRLVFLLEKMQEKGRRRLQTLNGFAVIFFSMVILFLGGIKMVDSGMTQISPILHLKMGYVFMVLPICAVLITILQIINIVFLWRGEPINLEEEIKLSGD